MFPGVDLTIRKIYDVNNQVTQALQGPSNLSQDAHATYAHVKSPKDEIKVLS